LFRAALIASTTPRCALLGIGAAFFFCALKRRYLNQDTLAFVTATGPAKTNNHSRKTAVLLRAARKSSITPGEVLQMIEISTADSAHQG